VTAYVLISSQISTVHTIGGRPLTHAPLACLNVSLEEPVDHVVELHETLVLAEVIFRLAQNVVNPAVRAPDADFPRLLERTQNLRLIDDT
jgi:hypothetical protein